MKNIYKLMLGSVVMLILTATVYVTTPYIKNAYDTRDWETFTNEEFGFTFKYPKEMQASGGMSPTTKGDVVIYRPGEITLPDGGYISISVVEGKENLDEQYADREKVRIRGKNWRYSNSGELTRISRKDSITGNFSPEGDIDEEHIYYWKEYIARLSPELRFEVYATYENPEYNRIVDIMVRSVKFK